jgi:predicted nucleic acid-binding protein
VILLDTNVLSELWRPVPDAQCLSWSDAQPRASIHACAPVLAELHAGIMLMPDGHRRSRLAEEYDRLVMRMLITPILPFAMECVPAFGRLRATPAGRDRAGKPLDLMIAAIALTHDMTLATRNVRDFEGLGVRLVNPFEA